MSDVTEEPGLDAAGPFEFDRYINGTLMAEGVCIERQKTLDAATPPRTAKGREPVSAPVSELVARLLEFADDLEPACEYYGGEIQFLRQAAARISELEAARSSERRAAEFAARWAWRDDPPHVTARLSDTERFSVIKFHPDIQAIAKRLGLLAGGKRDG